MDQNKKQVGVTFQLTQGPSQMLISGKTSQASINRVDGQALLIDRVHKAIESKLDKKISTFGQLNKRLAQLGEEQKSHNLKREKIDLIRKRFTELKSVILKEETVLHYNKYMNERNVGKFKDYPKKTFHLGLASTQKNALLG